ncbi:MAG: hypothetical protein LLG44_14720 [Chloroflexi bacterium]|nr:hypothetical protein [Chloroflexota bacterium]
MVHEYEYGRIRSLDAQLRAAGVPEAFRLEIMAGGEAVRKASSQTVKADWLRGAMERMDRLLDHKTRIAVREGCACCLGGKRAEMAKEIGKLPTIEERIAAANETHYVFGHSVTLEPDGRILVLFAPEGQPLYRCVCLGGEVKEPISLTYCQCCGGHIKHHLQRALGRKLACEPRVTALSSGQQQPCSFLFTILE